MDELYDNSLTINEYRTLSPTKYNQKFLNSNNNRGHHQHGNNLNLHLMNPQICHPIHHQAMYYQHFRLPHGLIFFFYGFSITPMWHLNPFSFVYSCCQFTLYDIKYTIFIQNYRCPRNWNIDCINYEFFYREHGLAIFVPFVNGKQNVISPRASGMKVPHFMNWGKIIHTSRQRLLCRLRTVFFKVGRQ